MAEFEPVPPGWDWFLPPPKPTAARPPEPYLTDLAKACARLFASADGRMLLAHLRRITLHRALGPDAGEARLRHLEGQRQLVLVLEALAARGRAAP